MPEYVEFDFTPERVTDSAALIRDAAEINKLSSEQLRRLVRHTRESSEPWECWRAENGRHVRLELLWKPRAIGPAGSADCPIGEQLLSFDARNLEYAFRRAFVLERLAAERGLDYTRPSDFYFRLQPALLDADGPAIAGLTIRSFTKPEEFLGYCTRDDLMDLRDCIDAYLRM